MDVVELRYEAVRCRLLASRVKSGDETVRLSEEDQRYTARADASERLLEPT